jgi:hypothetical protein
MTPNTDLNIALFERAKAVIPGGVNSPVRAFAAVGGTPALCNAPRAPISGTRTTSSSPTTSAAGAP